MLHEVGVRDAYPDATWRHLLFPGGLQSRWVPGVGVFAAARFWRQSGCSPRSTPVTKTQLELRDRPPSVPAPLAAVAPVLFRIDDLATEHSLPQIGPAIRCSFRSIASANALPLAAP
jgi:hypothetical protein